MSLSGAGEERAEQWIGTLLRAGVSLAAAVVLAGAVLYLWRHGQTVPDYRNFAPEVASALSAGAVLRGVEGGSSVYLIRLGLMLLIATPVARVALSLTLFARARDWMYCVVTGIVLTVLLASLWIA